MSLLFPFLIIGSAKVRRRSELCLLKLFDRFLTQIPPFPLNVRHLDENQEERKPFTTLVHSLYCMREAWLHLQYGKQFLVTGPHYVLRHAQLYCRLCLYLPLSNCAISVTETKLHFCAITKRRAFWSPPYFYILGRKKLPSCDRTS